MKIPTNELFSKVLNIKFEEIVSINIVNNKNYSILNSIDIEIKIDKDLVCHRGIVRGYTIFYINIYELAYKFKEWAYTKGFTIFTYKTDNGRYALELLFNHWTLQNFDCVPGLPSSFDNEHEAIFEACQHILDDKEDLL